MQRSTERILTGDVDSLLQANDLPDMLKAASALAPLRRAER
jgi:hypothetical protein